MSLLGFGRGTMLANFQMCGIMLALRAVFNPFVRNTRPTAGACSMAVPATSTRPSVWLS